MGTLICKKSVFSILFLFFFCLGTICGVLLFRFFSEAHPQWITQYCSGLSKTSSNTLWLQIWFALWPLLVVLGVGVLSGGARFIPAVILMRGCLLAYSAAAFYTAGLGFSAYLLRDFMLLPVFYGLCCYFCTNSNDRCSMRGKRYVSNLGRL